VPSLRALHAAGHEIQLVITQPDRPGHRMKVTPPPVKTAALQLGLEVAQPEKIRDPAVVERLRAQSPDVIVVVAYGQIIPRSILEIPPLGVVNVHASLLPRWRGAAPVAHAIMAGDEMTGVTIMRMDEQLDHGPVLATREVAIGADEDAAHLTQRLADIGAEMLVEMLEQLERIQPRAQDDSAATVAPRLKKEDGELEWGMGATEIDRRVRALQPWPGATLPTARGRVKVIKGHIQGDRYVLDLVQVPGRKPAPAAQVLGDA
jgi:methionyl-tRNA formyltransferase